MKRKTPRPVRPPNEESWPHEPIEAEPPTTIETDESSDAYEIDPDDDRWDAFLADEGELDPQPDSSDFWLEDD